MASQVFEAFKIGLLSNANFSDYSASDQKLRLMLVMNTTTVDSENDEKDTLANFTTLDQHDATINSVTFSNGKSGAEHLRTVTVSTTESSTTQYLTASGTITWTAVAAGTRAIQGVLLFKHTNESSADTAAPVGVPVAFFDFGGDVTAPGGNISVTFSTNRMISLT